MSDPNKHHELIIVRRHEDEEHEAHSSAWKVAHADFMTAMMAFFLIMWLINVTDEEVRKGISKYFNPIHLAEGQSEMKGLNQPNTTELNDGSDPGHSEVASPAGGKASEASSDTKAAESNPSSPTKSADSAETKPTAPTEAEKNAGGASEGETPKAEAEKGAETGGGDAAVAAGDRERAAFQDPYAVLSNLAAQFTAEHPTSADAIVGDDRMEGLATGDADRDPFDPIYWQMSKAHSARTEAPGANPLKGPAVPEDGVPDAASALTPPGDGASPAEPPPAAAKAPPAKAEPPAELVKPADPAILMAQRTEQAAALKTELNKSLGGLMAEGGAPLLDVRATAEGVLIDLTDNIDFSMFEIGSAIPNAKLVVLMDRIGKTLSATGGGIVVRGHTDGRPFRSEIYDNWRLSAARANMAYYMLVHGGLDDARVRRIEGYADRDLKTPDDPYAADNRRIEILVVEEGKT